jgi:dTDP-D-glucose 4,6-dehydratase
MTRMLATGGAGIIGATFVRYPVQNHPGYEVVVPLLLLEGMPAGRMDSWQVQERVSFRGSCSPTPVTAESGRSRC